MCESPIELTTEDGVTLLLRRFRPSRPHAVDTPCKTVLLLHGASANHATFTIPGGGLAAALAEHDKHNFDVWLLDWRGSSLVVDKNQRLLGNSEVKFTFNAAASIDVPAALLEMHNQGVQFPIAALGHCMGGAVLAEAIARGCVTTGRSGDDAAVDQLKSPKERHSKPIDLDCVVLLTLGLFYEAPIDSRIKSEERILEQLKSAGTCVALDPTVNEPPTVKEPHCMLKTPWPPRLEELYRAWPGQFHGEEQPRKDEDKESRDRRIVKHLCNRLSFMYGMPYHHDNLVDEMHGREARDGGKPVHPVLQKQFGAIPLDMFIHAARNLRQGHSTVYAYDDGTVTRPSDSEVFLSDTALCRFRSLESITLITGALNRLWHRNSIDLMYEWLTRTPSGIEKEKDPCPGENRKDGCRIKKQILPTYGHQDLLWGKRAADEVFPKILEGLIGLREPVATRSASTAAVT